MRVDAHHHLWRFQAEEFPWIGDDDTVLRRDFLPAELHAVLDAAGVTAAVAVQARCSLAETRFLLQCAAQSSRIARVVGWAPLSQPDIAHTLEKFGADRTLAGFREIAQDQPPGFLLRSSFREGVRELTARGYTYDVLIRAEQMVEAIEFVDQHPRQRFVLDHAAKPPIRSGGVEPWRSHLNELARRQHVWCKLSGLVTEADWQHWTEADIKPYLDACLEAFGPSRCMAGSDWPVCLLASSYGRWWRLLDEWAETLSAGEREAVLGLNAAAFYGIPEIGEAETGGAR